MCRLGVQSLNEQTKFFAELHHPMEWVTGKHGGDGWKSMATYLRLLDHSDKLPNATFIDQGKLHVGTKNLVEFVMNNVSKMESDKLSGHAREQGLDSYRCEVSSLRNIIVSCQQLLRHSIVLQTKLKHIERDKKEKAEKNKHKKQANVASGSTPKGKPKGAKNGEGGAPKGSPKGTPKGGQSGGQSSTQPGAQPTTPKGAPKGAQQGAPKVSPKGAPKGGQPGAQVGNRPERRTREDALKLICDVLESPELP